MNRCDVDAVLKQVPLEEFDKICDEALKHGRLKEAVQQLKPMKLKGDCLDGAREGAEDGITWALDPSHLDVLRYCTHLDFCATDPADIPALCEKWQGKDHISSLAALYDADEACFAEGYAIGFSRVVLEVWARIVG